MRLFSFSTLLLVITLPLRGAAVEQSLGQNLSYLRVHELPADLPKTAAAPRGALVLDLRFAHATENDAVAFGAWLKFYARPQSPVFLLANDQTDQALLAPLSGPEKPAGIVTLGPAKEGLNWDVPVKIPPEADRIAYDLFEHGASVDQLIVRKVEKVRRDEASMAKTWTGATTPTENEDAEESASAPAAPGAEKPPATVPPLDLVLQRAVQLHRALLALKKIPAR